MGGAPPKNTNSTSQLMVSDMTQQQQHLAQSSKSKRFTERTQLQAQMQAKLMTQQTETSEEPRKQRPAPNTVSGINLPSGQYSYGHHHMQPKVKKTGSLSSF